MRNIRSITTIAVATLAAAVATTISAAPAFAVDAVTVSPPNWDFGDQPGPVNSTPTSGEAKTFTVTNNTAATVTGTSATFQSNGTTDTDDFSVTSDNCSGQNVAAAASCTITVTPHLADTGAASDTLNIVTSGGSAAVNLTANGIDGSPVTATPGPEYVDLTWTDLGHDPATPITAYLVMRGQSPNALAPLHQIFDPTVHTYRDDDTVVGGVPYFYAILAYAGAVPQLPAQPANPAGVIPWTKGGAGTYYTLAHTTRFLDTRTTNGGHKGKLAAGSITHLQITGRGSIPSSGVSAVVLNLTGINASNATALAARPTGAVAGAGRSVFLAKGETRGNLVTVPLGTGGKIDISNTSAALDVVADVQGYYAKDTSIVATKGNGGNYGIYDFTPARVLDSRPDKLPSQSYYDFPVEFAPGFAEHVTAVAVAITAINATAPGTLVAWDGSTLPPPTGSSINYAAGVTIENAAIVKTRLDFDEDTGDDQPFIAIANLGSKPVAVIVDVVGFYDDDTLLFGERYTPFTTTVRLADSSTHSGIAGSLGPASQALINPHAAANASTFHMAINVTAVNPSATTNMSMWGYGIGLHRPTAGLLQALKSRTTVGSIVPLTGVNNVMYLSNAFGTNSVRVDAMGRFDEVPAFVPDSSSASSQTRPAGRIQAFGGVHVRAQVHTLTGSHVSARTFQ